MLISLYEIEGKNNDLELIGILMNRVWNLFFDKKTELLQKNIISNNDLFTNPIDINDNNIPNGNSTYLHICNKNLFILYLIQIFHKCLALLKY